MNWIAPAKWVVFLSLTVEIMLIIFLLPSAWLDKVLVKENKAMYSTYGSQTNDWLNLKSRKMYHTLFVGTGFAAVMEETILMTEEQYQNSGAMRDIGNTTWWIYVADRFEAARKMGHQFTKRVAVLAAFVPMALLLLIPCAWDGWMSWKVRNLSFKYQSSWIQGKSALLVKIGMTVIVVCLLAPFAIPPILTPAILLSITPLIGLVMIANAPKRI